MKKWELLRRVGSSVLGGFQGAVSGSGTTTGGTRSTASGGQDRDVSGVAESDIYLQARARRTRLPHNKE